MLNKDICKKCNGGNWNEESENIWDIENQVKCPHYLYFYADIKFDAEDLDCPYSLESIMANDKQSH